MFNKLKQFKDLRDQAKTLQSALAKESITLDKNGVKLTMNGNMEVTNIVITEQLANDKMASTMKDLMNDSVKKMQRIMAEKMQSMGGFPGLGM
ncbi:MAG: YbaB/EbfC family nucleoid-associated protein [bacterium]